MVAGLEHLPYDILVYIFQELDKATLKAACRSSRRLNEPATSVLYRNVIVWLCKGNNAKQPFEAFERRPFLRKVVRGVTCRATIPSYKLDPVFLEKQARDISSQLRSLPNVERLIFRYGFYHEPKVFQYISVLSDWPKLRRIEATSDVLKYLMTLKDLHSRFSAVNTLTVQWCWGSTILRNDLAFWSTPLQDLTLVSFPTEKIPNCLVHFSNLTRLSIKEGRWSGGNDWLFEAIVQLHPLEDLKVDIIIDSTSTSFLATGLRNLKSLDICFCYPRREDKAPLVGALDALLDALAGQSYLHCLKLKSLFDVKTYFLADRFVGKALQRHGSTLRRLSLGQFHPSSSTFQKIFKCRYMKRLTIGVTRTFANDLSLYLVPTSPLETLTICFRKDTARFSRPTIQALLGQTSSPLTTIKVRITATRRYQTTTNRWTSITNYDSDMKQAIRTISGPMVLFQPIPLSILDDPEWD